MGKGYKKALYIGRCGLPNNAPSIRIYNNSKILHKLGYHVDVLCLLESDDTQVHIVYSDWLQYFFIREKNHKVPGIFDKIRDTLEVIFNHRAIKKIIEQIKVSEPQVIVTYNDLFFSSLFLIRYCKKHGIKLVCDVTEWYEKRPLQKNIASFMLPLLTDWRIRYLDVKIGNIIAISPYLKQYYQSKKCNNLYLPPVFDQSSKVNVTKYNYYDHHVINFIYAGSPGNKDILMPFIKTVYNINSSTIKIRFDIFGVDESYISDSNYLNSNLEDKGIIFHGRVRHEEINSYLDKADFSVLLRHNKRYAKAGFSTKLAESMLNGVAIFANKVGGAESIIENNVDGIIISDTNENTIQEKLEKLLLLSDENMLSLRIKAAKKASDFFNMRKYITQTEDFLNK